MNLRVGALAVAAMVCTLTHAQAIDLDPFVNIDITGFTGGSGYPQNGGTVTISGIDHELAKTADGKSGGAFFHGRTTIVPINVFGVKDIYTIMNSGFGAIGQLNGTLTAVGSGGLSQVFNLTQGDNIRDHFNGVYNNVATGLNGTISYPTGVRLDQQRFSLDPAFHSATLLSVELTGLNNGGSNGLPFISAMTLDPVPEPGLLAALGIGALAAFRRRKAA